MRADLKYLLATVLVMAATSSALGQVRVSNAWVRATVARQSVTGAFMRLDSPTDARLISATTPAAGAVEIHRMSMESDVMKMAPVTGIDIPAGTSVSLQPGGYHLMLIKLKSQIKAGDTIPLTLLIEDRDHKRTSVEVRATARPLNAAGGMGAMPRQ
ncbi:MAG: copper chaperone PCu(A)C [Burkholderiaceae bacterium]|nr:copper chaperone PCu(A)C [Burkholderiaceae bacterium]